jgi:hypothetical protein
METSIAVRGSTLQLLMMLKEKMKAKSIDETIVRTIQKVENAPRSQFGSNPKLKSFSRKDRAEFHEL